MLYRAVFATIAAATVAFGAALPERSQVAPFNPTAKPLPTPVYEEREQPMTNAERLRRGMAPLPPKMKRQLHAPGPAGAPPPDPSPSGEPSAAEPALTHEGIIQVADAESGKVLGYVNNKLNSFGQLGVDKTYEHPIEVIFKTVRADAKPGSITITNGDSRPGKYFGAVVSEFAKGSKLGEGEKAFTYLTRVGETKSGLGPMNVFHAVRSRLGLKLKAESSIWNANQFTGELSATWTNPGGEPVAATVFYYESKNALALTADPEAFGAAHEDAILVKLSIINKPLN